MSTFSTREEVERIVQALERLGPEWGLALNKQKSLILTDIETQEIGGIRTTEKAKYLGVWLHLDRAKQKDGCKA